MAYIKQWTAPDGTTYDIKAASCTGNAATATALTTNAGSSTIPVYFSGGKPVQCSTTLAVDITGSATNANRLDSLDTRSATRTPQDTPKGITLNFKSNSTDGLSDGGSYNGLLSWRSYGTGSDLSGGQPIEIGYTANGNLWTRMGTSATTWSGWTKILNSTNYTSYTVTKTGEGASGTWPISISGNADTLDGYHASSFSQTSHTHSYLPLSGGTMTGSLTFANGTKNVVGDDCAIGDINNAGTLAIQGQNGTTNLWLGQYGAGWSTSANHATISYDGTNINIDKIINGTVTNAYYLSNVSHSISLAVSSWSASNPWGASNFTRVWGQQGKWSAKSSDTADMDLFYGNTSACGGAGWFLCIDGGIYSLNGIYSAVWNDYAEFRKANSVEPGRCIIEKGDDTLILSTKRLQPGAEIISDTFGFAIGKTDECQTPIAAAGRVLAYPAENRYSYKVGQPVCSGPNGTVSQMTDEEMRLYPNCIIGYVSAIPEYEEWGTGKVKVDGRIWIRIR